MTADNLLHSPDSPDEMPESLRFVAEMDAMLELELGQLALERQRAAALHPAAQDTREGLVGRVIVRFMGSKRPN